MTKRNNRPRRWRPALAVLPALALLPGAELAADPAQYEGCIALARQQSGDAFRSAVEWRDAGGGDPARHCMATALFGLGQFAEAGAQFEELARDTEGPERRAEILGQSAQAWIRAEEPAHAHGLLTRALNLKPRDPDLLIDRSITSAALGQHGEAVGDLSLALEVQPDRPDALLFRATAYRELAQLDLARRDVERALQLRPRSPDALLERGIIRQMSGDRAGARRDWIDSVLAAPDTPTADIAQRLIEQMDLRVE